MITDLSCIQLIQDAYNGTGTFDQPIEADYVKVFIKNYDDATLIVFPGSESFIDWIRDFQADMRDDPQLGGIEWGFQQGLRDVYQVIQPQKCGKPVWITGHSLGAARALLFAGLMVVDGSLPHCVVTFGSPRPGGGKLKSILAPVPIRSYRNGDDKVCGVPFYLPWFRPYQHPRPLIQVNEPPLPNDSWGVFRFHHSFLYEQALAKLFPN